jgi:hypothetical protein
MIPASENLPHPNTNIPLEHLYLLTAHPLQLAEFLEKTPCLKALRIPFPLHELHGSMLGQEAIPQLNELQTTWSLCVRILPGRPISHLNITSKPKKWRRDEVGLLASSTKQIVQLSIPISEPICFPFWEHFPGLETFELRIHGNFWGKVLSHPHYCNVYMLTNQET